MTDEGNITDAEVEAALTPVAETPNQDGKI